MEELQETLGKLEQINGDLTALSYAFLRHNDAVIVNGVSSLSQLEANVESYRNMPKLTQQDYERILDAVKLIRYGEHRA